MTNVLSFPSRRRVAGSGLLSSPPAHTHAVQFYEEDDHLFAAVGEYVGAGLHAGDRLVVIATPAHREGFLRGLEGANDAIATGQLQMLDARETLAKFMVGDAPDPDLFRDVLSRVMTDARDGAPTARVRAYGEMVDLLWQDGNPNGAIRLEELWNETQNEQSFSLLCAYVMGNFYREGDTSKFLEVCRGHSHVLPTESYALHEDESARLREISLLQQRARSLEHEIQHRRELEAALREALRQRTAIESDLRESITRERDARARAEASDAFKEMFLGMLGHDLRNPLSSILTTVRLMTMRGELQPASRGRLERVLSSAQRMERMIEQLLDVTRARLSEGFPVDRRPHDLAVLVRTIVDEIQLAHPEQTISYEGVGPLVVELDADRMERVVSNLVGNAVAHGDPSRPIRVTAAIDGGSATVCVHNYGPVIERDLLARLFDPFTYGQGTRRRSSGLGLGLYISRCIVVAHGGRIEVDSNPETGTQFAVIVPLR